MGRAHLGVSGVTNVASPKSRAEFETTEVSIVGVVSVPCVAGDVVVDEKVDMLDAEGDIVGLGCVVTFSIDAICPLVPDLLDERLPDARG